MKETTRGWMRLATLAEDATEKLDVIPRQRKVVRHVREKLRFLTRDRRRQKTILNFNALREIRENDVSR